MIMLLKDNNNYLFEYFTFIYFIFFNKIDNFSNTNYCY
jgi:hypothetical protein